MGFFDKLGGLITNPIRGVGRLVRGDIGGALGDILPTAGLALGGAGLLGAGPLAGALGGGGGIGGVLGKAGGLKGVLGQAGGFLKDNPELIGAGLAAVQGARQQGKVDDRVEQALRLALDRRAQEDAARQNVMGRLEGIQFNRPDLNDVFADPSNPFSRPLSRPETSSTGSAPRDQPARRSAIRTGGIGRLGPAAFGGGGEAGARSALTRGRLDPRAFNEMLLLQAGVRRPDEEFQF